MATNTGAPILHIPRAERNWLKIVLGPKVIGHAVGLHPPGAMFAVPVAGVTWVLVAAVYRHLFNAAPVVA